MSNETWWGARFYRQGLCFVASGPYGTCSLAKICIICHQHAYRGPHWVENWAQNEPIDAELIEIEAIFVDNSYPKRTEA